MEKMTLHPVVCDKQIYEWKVEMVPKIRYHLGTVVKHLGTIDTSNQTFRIRLDIYICCEMTPKELKSYLKNKEEFQPDSHKQVTFGNRKEFVAEWVEHFQCYWIR